MGRYTKIADLLYSREGIAELIRDLGLIEKVYEVSTWDLLPVEMKETFKETIRILELLKNREMVRNTQGGGYSIIEDREVR